VRARLLASVFVALALGAGLLSTQSALAAQSCGTSAGYNICLNAPDGPLSGEVTISADVTNPTGVKHVTFRYAPSGTSSKSLLRDYEAPYSFIWPTTKYLDGSVTLSAQVTTSSTTGTAVTLSVTLANGNTSRIQREPADWDSVFNPRPPAGSDPVTAAVGDAANGVQRSEAVEKSIAAANPNLFLYLGDVNETGTFAEFRTHYGLQSFNDPAGRGTLWGSLAGITQPTQGNHETGSNPPYKDYWHQRPPYTSFDFGGVHYLNLNSQCSSVGGCGTTSAQYAFAQNDLANTTESCVVAFWHKPATTTAEMQPLWALVAQNGGDIVLVGHVHQMAEYKPLNAALQADQPDSHMVQLISAGGGFQLTNGGADARRRWKSLTDGAVYLTAVGGASGQATALDWEFRDVNGSSLRSGRVGCGGGTTPPTTTTFTSSVDARVEASNPTSNFGSSTRLTADGDPDIRSYLKFNVQGLSGSVTKATLRLFTTSSSSSGHDARGVIDNSWDEGTINYNNAPPVGAVVGNSGNFSSSTWTTVDVTRLITGNGTYTIAVTSPSASAKSYHSSEAANVPELVIETVG
jgi:hypothetical protein